MAKNDSNKAPEKCEGCGENAAKIRLMATGVDGVLLDEMWICYECTDGQVIEFLPGCEDAAEQEE